MRLFPAVAAAPPNAVITATGVSCRQQIAQGTSRRAVHPVMVLRDAVSRMRHSERSEESSSSW
jgi:Fe-S oxidoreductase